MVRASRKWRGVFFLAVLIIAAFSITTPVSSQESEGRIVVKATDSYIRRSGNWQAASLAEANYLASSGSSQEDGLTLDFAGTYLEVIYAAGPDYGILAIEVDGQVLRTISTSANDLAAGQSAVIDYLDNKAHVAKVYPVAGVIAIDAFVVDALAPVPQPLHAKPGPSDYWAVEVTAGTDPAVLGARLGYQYLRNIAGLPNIYLYIMPGTGTQSLLAVNVANTLQNTSEVVWFEQQVAHQMELRPVPSDPGLANQWHLINTGQGGGVVGEDANLTGAWQLDYDGSNVIVGIVDDGMDITHADLAPNYNANASYDYNFNDHDPSHSFASDGHGTAVAGVVAAAEDTGVGSCGVGAAYDAQIAGLRLISTGTTDADEAEALSNALATTPGVVMISSNSWGPSDSGNVLEKPGPLTLAAMENQTNVGRAGRGVVYVWAGGNGADNDDAGADGYASSRFTIAVGATTNTGARSWYSEQGSAILVNAPSNGGTLGISTTDRTGSAGYSGTNCTNTFGGTSSAAPLVSGIVALMLDANPSLDWRDVQYILVQTAEKNSPSDPSWITNGAGLHFSHYFGFGRVDAGAAILAAEEWEGVDPYVSQTSDPISVGLPIPNNNSVGVSSTTSFSLPDVGRLEHVEVVLNASHARRGELSVTLTSPSGTTSTLIRTRTPDSSGAGFNNWKFTSVAFWGEDPTGTWTLTVKDLGTFNNTPGTFNSWELTLYGLEPAENEVLVAPAGDIITTAPTFTWTYVTVSDWYRLHIRQVSDNSTVFDRWYRVGSSQLTCASGTCTLTPDFTLGSAGTLAIKWRLQPFTTAGGIGYYTSSKPFNILAPPQISPAGSQTLPLGNPLFQWSQVTDGVNVPSWYQLYVARPGGSYAIWLPVGGGVTCASGTCSARPSDLGTQYDLNTGAHNWFVRGFREGIGYTPWASGQNFAITATSLPQITKTSPLQSADLSNANVNFTWTHNTNARSYDVYVSGPNGFVDYHSWDADTYCSGANCSITIPVTANGVYTWYLRGLNAAGGGAWGPNDAGGNLGAVTFNVLAAIPVHIVKQSPVSTTVTTGMVTFSWAHNANAISYEVFVSGPNGFVDYHSWDAATYCSGGNCSIKILVGNNGAYTWYLRGKSQVGFGPWGPNDAGGNFGATTFTVNAGAVAVVTKNSPTQSSSVLTNAVTLTWVDTANAATYEIFLSGPNGYVNFQTYIPGQNATCAAGTCSTTIFVPSNGPYQWYMRGWSPNGFGPWGPNQAGGDFGLRTFSVNAPLPSPINAALLSPGHNSTVANPGNVTFQWTASNNATWYGLVLVNRATGAIVSTTWYNASTIACPAAGNTCTISQSVAVGNYRWGVLVWGPQSSAIPALVSTFNLNRLGL